MTTDLDSRPAAPARRRWLRVHLGGAAAIALGLGLARSGRAADLPRFTLGVASGEPRPDGMVLWTRLMGENLPQRVPVRWEVAHDEAFQRPAAQGTEWAEAAWAHSVHAEPVGLEAGRPYWYRFTALGDRSPIGRTRTAPAPDAVATLNFAIASCQRLEHGHYAAWRDIVASDPDLILFLGDYLYEYGLITTRDPVRPVEGGRITTLEGYRARYAQYRADPLLQAAHAAAPWLVTWDDHEVENDYAGPVGGFPLEDFAARRAAATQAWWEHLPLPQAARPRGPEVPIYRRVDWGRLARIHLLDNRQYRSPQACPPPGRLLGAGWVGAGECSELDDPRRSLLGMNQERWLAEGWSLQRPWNLVAQQTLMAPLRQRRRDARAPAGAGAALPPSERAVWTDGWDGYAPARRRLLETAAQKQVPGLVVLGGDVHAHFIAQLQSNPEDDRSPVIGAEFCGTSISSRGQSQTRLDAARADNPHLLVAEARHRGSIHFRLDARRLQADLRAVQDLRQADSAVRSIGRYAVEAGQPGVVAA